MRVGFDVSPLVRPHPPGIVRLVGELVRALEELGRVEVERLAPGPEESVRAWRRSAVPREVARRSLLGIHSFLSAFPVRGPGKRVHTVHELPWRHGVSENAGLGHRFWAGPGTRFADATVTGTEVVARELRRSPFVRAARVHVVPWGVGPPFEEEPPPSVVDEVVLAKYRLPESPLILCLGAVRAKKNLAAVLRGCAVLERRDWHVVVTGEHTEDLRRDLGLVSQLGLARRVSTPGLVAEEDLPSLLRTAAVVPVLSRSEGFGLPVLEALACGTPVVVPRGSAQEEVAGGRGIAVEPGDARSVAAGLERGIAEREELRYVLPERARELSWKRSAERVSEVWEGLA